MKKSSKHSKNSTAKYYMSTGGMVNTVGGEYLKDNQASYLGSVYFDEEKKSFAGSGSYKAYNTLENYKFNRLFNVRFKGEEKLFGSYAGGVYNITDNQDYPLDEGAVPSDIISNQDGVFVSSSNNIYNITEDTHVEKLTFSLSPFAWQSVFSRTSGSTNSNALIYYDGKVYFSDSRGLGYFLEDTLETVIINNQLGSLDFYIFNNILFAEDDYNIYTIKDKSSTLFYNKAPIGNAYRHSAGYDKYLMAIKERNGRYDICRIDIYTKEISYIPLKVTYGLGGFGLNFVRVLNNRLYVVINTLVPLADGYTTRVSTYLLEIELINNEYVVVDRLIEDYDTGLFLYSVFKLSSSMFCTFGAPYYKEGLPQRATYIVAELRGAGELVKLNYLFAPDAYQTSVYIAISGSRIYVANYMAIYYVDIKVDKSDIPCIFTQNGRLVAAQGSSLYFSGVGDFFNWSYGSDNDALFCEIGYKDGGNIIYAVSVYDSIIVFKDNGNIYRLAGNYPLWSISKLGEINELTSRAITAGSEIIFSTSQGIKRLGVTQNFGDFFISDYQSLIIDNNITDISICSERNTVLFCLGSHIYEYNNILKAFYIFNYDSSIKFNQCIEVYDNGIYHQFCIDENGVLYLLDNTVNSHINITFSKLKSNLNIVVKALTIFTDILETDKEIVFSFDEGCLYNLTLKAGRSRHKFFITRRLNQLQPKVSHEGDFYINNFFIEYSSVGE